MIWLCSCCVSCVCSSMRYTMLLWLLIMIFCNKLGTAAQSYSIIMSTPSSLSPSVSSLVDNITFISFTDVPTSVAPTLLPSSPDVGPVTSMDILTFTSLSLVPTGAIMTAPVPSVDTSMPFFVITVTTTAVSAVDATSTEMMTTVAMTSSSIVPVTTTITNTTISPAEEDDNDGFSMGVIVGIAAGGGTAFLVIHTIVICWVCCYCHKRRQRKAISIPMVMSPTIQVRPQQQCSNWAYASQISRDNWAYASQMSKASTTSNTSQLSRISKSLRDSFRRHKERNQVEGVKLIPTVSNTMLSTPV